MSMKIWHGFARGMYIDEQGLWKPLTDKFYPIEWSQAWLRSLQPDRIEAYSQLSNKHDLQEQIVFGAFWLGAFNGLWHLSEMPSSTEECQTLNLKLRKEASTLTENAMGR